MSRIIIILAAFLIFCLGVPPAYAADKGADPVAYWKFDEGGGGTAYDESANNNDGTLTPGAAGSNTQAGQMWTPQGKIGGALELDGTNDYVTVADNAGLRITGDITISFWMKKNAEASDWARLVGKGVSPPRNYGVWEEYGAGKRILWQQYNSTGGSVLDFFSQTNIEIGNWYFITTVVSGTNAYIYINGKLDASGTRSGTPGTSADPVTVGYAGFHTYFPGLIDDVRIYDYARTAEQILVDYNAGAAAHLGAGADPNEGNPPVGYWSFNENTGTSAYDKSGNANDGTLTNGPTWTQGKNGPCLSFDGVDDWVTIADSTSLNITGSLTMSAWIRTTLGRGIIGKWTGTDSTSQYLLYVDYTGRLIVEVAGAAGVSYRTTNSAIPSEVWIHVAGVYDATAQTLALYINGATPATTLTGTVPSSLNSTTTTIYIGTMNPGGFYFKGSIDDIRIYNYARTQAQIAYDYNKGKPIAHYKFDEGTGKITHNEYSTADTGIAPVAWWRMDEGTSGSANGATITNESGGGNNGTADDGANNTGMSWASGKIGPGALSFDGTDDYVNTTLTNIDWNATNWSVSVWASMNAGTSLNYRGIVGNRFGAGAANWFTLGMFNSGIMTIELGPGSGVSYINFGSFNPIGQGWQHYTITKSGTTITLYRNGAVVGGGSSSGRNLGGTTNNVWIGQWLSTGQNWNGSIDDVRVYNYARTAEQIYNDYLNTHGTLVGDTKFTDGKIGKALQFDGTGDYVDVSNNALLQFTSSQSFSVAAWVYVPSLPSAWKGIVTKSRDASPWYGIWISNTNNWVFGGSANISGGAVTVGWHHIAIVQDVTNNNRILYVDGTQDATGTVYNANGSGNLRIGNSAGVSEDFNGLIDDVRIYNYARTAAQISEDYNVGASRLGAQSAGEKDPWGGNLPIAHWKMDENTGVLARDASGNGNDGTLTNGPTWTQGKIGPCLSFDGVDDYVNLGTSGMLQPSNITAAFWFKRTGTFLAYAVWLWAKGSGGNVHSNGWAIRISEGKFTLHVDGGGGPGYDVATAPNTLFPLNVWTHVTATFNSTTNAGAIYINGIDQNATLRGSPDSITATADTKYMGSDSSYSESYLLGLLDDVRIYNYARTPAQIAWDYNKGKPVAHWRMNEATTGSAHNQTIYDDSDNNNDGTGNYGANTTGMSWTTGKFGGALSFDGVDDYVWVGSTTGFSTSAITVAAWVKPIIDNTQNIILDGATSPTAGICYLRLEIYSNNKIRVGFGNGVSWGGWSDGDTTLLSDTWYYLVGTWDGSTITAYVNGKVDDPTPGSWAGPFVVPAGIKIGAYTGSGYNFPGSIDDVRIYNYARTPLQILEDYNHGAAARLGD